MTDLYKSFADFLGEPEPVVRQNVKYDRNITNKILELLGGKRNFVLDTGSTIISSIENGISMKLRKNKSGYNKLEITLKNNNYTIKLYNQTKLPFKKQLELQDKGIPYDIYTSSDDNLEIKNIKPVELKNTIFEILVV